MATAMESSEYDIHTLANVEIIFLFFKLGLIDKFFLHFLKDLLRDDANNHQSRFVTAIEQLVFTYNAKDVPFDSTVSISI